MDPLANLSIVVCVKQVPDSWAQKSLRPDDHRLDRDGTDAVLNEPDEHAIEAALQIKAARPGPTTVTALSMGPPPAAASLRKALQMGADEAVHLVDPALAGTDAVGTSYALAQVLRTIPYDLIVLGSESTDARMSVLPAMLAEQLGIAALTLARSVMLDESGVTIERVLADGHAVVRAELPAVVSVVAAINVARNPTFTAIMAAKKKTVTALSLADVGADLALLGLAGAGTAVVEAVVLPAKAPGDISDDDGTGGLRLAEYLAAHAFG